MADDTTGHLDEFTAEVRAFLDASARRRPDPGTAVAWGVGDDTIAYFSTDPPDVDRANAEQARRWQRRPFDAGRGWITGPLEYGGSGVDTRSSAGSTSRLAPDGRRSSARCPPSRERAPTWPPCRPRPKRTRQRTSGCS